MEPSPGTRDLEALVADLRLLRRQGLVRLRHLDLPTAAQLSTAAPRSAAFSAEAEALLRAAVAGLGGGHLGEAAAYTFGLAPGTRDWPAQDRRHRAAEVYGVSVERFRKHHEQMIFEQVAEQLEHLAANSAAADAPTAGTHGPSSETPTGSVPGGRIGPGSEAPTGSVPAAPIHVGSDQPLRSLPLAPGTRIELTYRTGGREVPFTVHVRSVDLLSEIDVVVCPTNVFLEVAKIYSATVAGRLRDAAAVRDQTGRVVDDVLQRELLEWHAGHGGIGVAVPPGTVASTSAGALRERGIRRIYHAAVAAPAPTGNEYHVAPESVVRAVREVFALARRERADPETPVFSLCFPLIGSGRGGLPVEESIQTLCWVLREELDRDPDWYVHLVAHRPERAGLLLRHLHESGLRET